MIFSSHTINRQYFAGDIKISGEIMLTVDSDLNGASPKFTLSCITTGGPATTVTWTRDSTPVTQGTDTVLNDPVTAQYTHTLTVTGRLPGLYTCTVANNKPSTDSATISPVLGIHSLNFLLAAILFWDCTYAHKGLFNLQPQFSRLGTQGRVVVCAFCMYLGGGSGCSFSSIYSEDAINMLFHGTWNMCTELDS